MSRPNPNSIGLREARILGYDIPTIARMMEDNFPVVWKRMFTRSINATGNYYSSKALAVGLTGAIEETRVRTKLESNIGFIAGILEQHDFPQYYVSEQLFTALKHSHPPDGLKWQDLTLPFPALVFMLPRGSLKEPPEHGGADIIYIGIANLPAGKAFTVPTQPGLIQPCPEDRLSVFWSTAPSGLVLQDATFPASHPLEPLPEWIDSKTDPTIYVGPKGEFSAWVAGLVANLILVMEARKELVEAGECTRKPGKGTPGLYTPTFIGRNYAVIRKDRTPAQSHFTELGWRAGHFKRQHFGPKNEQVKTIFIEPYIAFTRGLQPQSEGVLS